MSVPIRIVAVEDNPADVALLRFALEEHIQQYELHVLPDGAQAMKFLDGDSAPPDLFVVDLNLPFCDGLDVLRRIKQMPRWAASPVAILTTSDSHGERESSLKLGASCFLQKPSELDAYLSLGADLKQCYHQALSNGQ